MRRILQIILLKPVLWAAKKFSSKPDPRRIFKALTELKTSILTTPGEKGPLVEADIFKDRVIVFSDQHRGAKNWADDFREAEPCYLAALDFYNTKEYTLISLGDAEELWENSLSAVKKWNTATFGAEKKFIGRKAFIKVFGNHDLYWANDPLASRQLRKIYDADIKICEGVILRMVINNEPFLFFLTHGHQGDKSSDGNWFSKFFVARIWAPLQSYLRVNPNTPAYDEEIKTLHNRIMYDWSSKEKGLCLVTGHTHQPVFESLTHLERLHRDLLVAKENQDTQKIHELEQEIRRRKKEYKSLSIDFLNMTPGYFNSGCCCFNDGDITGIEIADGFIRLIKWEQEGKGIPVRKVLEETEVSVLQQQLA